MVFLGLVGLCYCNPRAELRTSIMFLILLLIGGGSAALHGTLHWLWQSSDELPMLYATIAFNYNIYFLQPKNDEYASVGALVSVVLCVVQTFIYYRMQHLYWVFLLQYISVLVALIFASAYCVFSCGNRAHYPVRFTLFSRALFCYIFIGSILWIYEMKNCAFLLPYYSANFGLSFHILWHIGAGLGTYLEILLLTAMRVQSLGGVVEVTWHWFGFLPILREAHSKQMI